jgi:hypothetical protein
LICQNQGVGTRLALALAVVLAAVVLSGCGDEPSAQSPPPGQSDSTATEVIAPGAQVPARIVALTEEGDVVVIDRETQRAQTIATFPPREDPEVAAGSFRAVDVTALPDGRVLLATCCEPAAGHMYALTEDGRRLKDQDLFAFDAGHDADGARVASGEIMGLVIRPVQHLTSATSTLGLPPGLRGFAPEDISWSPEANRILFTIGGKLAVVDASAGSLVDATYLEAPAGAHWSGAAYTQDGAVAVEQGGELLHPSGSSRLVRVDLETGESAQLVSTKGRITDLAVDPSGSYLLWVEDGRLRWLAGAESGTLDGTFVAADWLTAPA